MHYTCSRFRVVSLSLSLPRSVLSHRVVSRPRSTEDLRRRDSRSDDSSGEFASLESATCVAATPCDRVWQPSPPPPSLPSSRPFHWCFRHHRYEFHVVLRTLTDYCHVPRCASRFRRRIIIAKVITLARIPIGNVTFVDRRG